MLQFKHRDKDYCLLFLFWKSTIVFRIKSGVSSCGFFKISSKEVCTSLLHLEASKLQAWLHTLYGGRTILRFSFNSWFPSPIPDLYEVAPSSTLLPILCLPPTLEVFRVAPIHSLLPIHCLPPSLTSTRVLIGRVSSDQVSLVLILV